MFVKNIGGITAFAENYFKYYSMWTCPNCERLFKTTNQSHSCVNKTIDDLFVGRPDHLVLAFDKIMTSVLQWEPNSLGPSKNAVVFTNKKAWLILKPMTRELDLKFYYSEPLESPVLKKVATWGKKIAHHIRIINEDEVTDEVLRLLGKGFAFGMK